MAAVWSGATGDLVRAWDGPFPDGLFGHFTLLVPDLDGDGLADVVIAAPTARIAQEVRGVLVARSPKTGTELWRHDGTRTENLGWHLALAGDHDGDGRPDLFAGAPSQEGGRVYLLAARDGRVLRTYAPPAPDPSFGWYVARVDDLDADGHADLAVGAHGERGGVGGAFVFSSVTGKRLRHWRGPRPLSGFGEVVTAVGDLDGDGRGEVVVASPGTADWSRTRPGRVDVFSGATGKRLRRWRGTQAGELFGRMVVSAGDVDGDDIDDVAIGAPWYRRAGDARVGRLEIRSGADGALLHALAGDVADAWFGWHIRRAPDPEGQGRPALLVASLRHPVDGEAGVGVVDLYVLRRPADQGTTSRDVRRSDIR